MYFFPKLCAFNISWHEDAGKPTSISTYVTDPNTGHKKAILKNGEPSPFYAAVSPTQRYAACTTLLKPV